MKIKKLVSLALVFVLSLTLVFTFNGCTPNAEDLQIDSYRLERDEAEDEDVIIIKFHFKNNTGHETSMSDEYEVNVYQNDVALEEYYTYYADYEEWKDAQESPSFKYNDDSQYTRVRDGGVYYPEMAFRLEDTESDIDVEIGTYSLFDKKVTKVVTIKQ